MKILSPIANYSVYTQPTQNFKGGNYAEYLSKRQATLRKSHTPVKYWTLDKFDMDKLEGIQEGLKTIGNLTMKQIKSITDRILTIVLQRGCNNECAHCYADARVENFYKDKNTISKIDFDDFKNFCEDFQTLNKKMGFNIFKRKRPVYYQTLFHDSDSSMITAKDKTGKEYDYLDLSKMLHDTCDEEILFDTAGWNIQDKKTQERMEKLVKKFNENYDKYKFLQFNLSFNPFQSLYYNSVLKEREGKHEIAQKLREAYIIRMANVINTFLPLIEEEHYDNFNIIAISFPNAETQETQGFQQKDLENLWDEVKEKVAENYVKGYDEYVALGAITREQLDSGAEGIKDILSQYVSNPGTDLVITGRLAKNFKVKNARKTMNEVYPNADNETNIRKMVAALIDLNGKVYLTNYQETYPTNVQLNYINKDKHTAPINPTLHEHIVEI